jgi:SAM-dependent methyltransferase
MTMDPYQELTLYQRSSVLMAAAELGAFAALADGPATAAEIAGRIGATADAAERLMEALLALEYVSSQGGRFALNDFSRSFLRDGAGGMLRLAWKEHIFYEAWSRLAQSIKSGKPQFPSYAERIKGDFPSVEKFLLALNDLGQMAAPGVIATGAFAGARTILDLGGGAAGYAAELSAAIPGAQVTLADLPAILPIARGHLERKGLAGRVELVAADFLVDGCGIAGRSFDRVFLSHILHDFEAAAASAIVARAARLVGPGGRLVILDVLVPDAGPRNPVEALFDLMMLVEVPGGRSHRLADVRAWMAAAGLGNLADHKLYFGCLVEARAP